MNTQHSELKHTFKTKLKYIINKICINNYILYHLKSLIIITNYNSDEFYYLKFL